MNGMKITFSLDQVLELAKLYQLNKPRLSSSLTVAMEYKLFPDCGAIFVLELLEKIKLIDEGGSAFEFDPEWQRQIKERLK